MVSGATSNQNGRMTQISHRRVPDTLPSVRSVQRDSDGAALSGLCAGIARQTGIDVLLVRTAAILLGLSAGFGVILYAGLSVMTPVNESTEAPLDKYWRDWRKHSDKALGWGLLGLSAAFAVMFGSASPFGWAPAIILIVAWRIAAHHDRKLYEQAMRAARPQALPPGVVWAPTAALPAAPTQPAQWQVYGQPPMQLNAPAPVTARVDAPKGATAAKKGTKWQARALTLLTLAIATGTWFVVASPPMGFTNGYLVANSAALLVVGVGLIVRMKLGRSIVLILTGIGLSIGVVAAAVPGSDLWAGAIVNDRFVAATDLPDAMTMTATNANLDFSELDLTTDATIVLDTTMSNVSIVTPDTTKVQFVLDAQTAATTVQLPDGVHSGFQPVDWQSDTAGLPTLTIELNATMSNVKVRQP